MPAEHAGLLSREVHATELQELAVLAESQQIACFGQDGQGIDWADAGDCNEQFVVRVIGQEFDGPRLELVALANQASVLGQH